MTGFKLREHAPRFAAEFVVIVTGVLVALFADGLRQDAENRDLEIQYIERIVSELQADSTYNEGASQAFSNKAEGLDRLSRWDGADIDDDLLRDLARSSGWAWEMAPANSATYDEMLSSGRLGLIRDTDLRTAVTNYYRQHKNTLGSIDARRTDMGPLGYRLLRRAQADSGSFEAPPAGLEAMSEYELAALASPAAVEAIRQEALAELNFSGYAARQMNGAAIRAGRLAVRLREYLQRSGS